MSVLTVAPVCVCVLEWAHSVTPCVLSVVDALLLSKIGWTQLLVDQVELVEKLSMRIVRDSPVNPGKLTL